MISLDVEKEIEEAYYWLSRYFGKQGNNKYEEYVETLYNVINSDKQSKLDKFKKEIINNIDLEDLIISVESGVLFKGEIKKIVHILKTLQELDKEILNNKYEPLKER